MRGARLTAERIRSLGAVKASTLDGVSAIAIQIAPLALDLADRTVEMASAFERLERSICKSDAETTLLHLWQVWQAARELVSVASLPLAQREVALPPVAEMAASG
jgi:hypothetical protein